MVCLWLIYIPTNKMHKFKKKFYPEFNTLTNLKSHLKNWLSPIAFYPAAHGHDFETYREEITTQLIPDKIKKRVVLPDAVGSNLQRHSKENKPHVDHCLCILFVQGVAQWNKESEQLSNTCHTIWNKRLWTWTHIATLTVVNGLGVAAQYVTWTRHKN